MTPSRVDSPSTADLVARATGLAPLIKEHAAAGERDRRVAEEVIRALAGAGLFKLATPKRYGGYETSARTLVEVSAAVAEADGGTSWVLTLINGSAWLVSLFPERAQDEVFGADPDALVSGVISPTAQTVKVDGGWRVTGKWYYNSGSWHATWAVLGVPVTDETGTVVDQGSVLIPRHEMELEDTWFVAGMRSSGSNCLIADDVFVPEHRMLRMPAALEGDYPTEHHDEVLYRAALMPLLSLVLAAPQLGMGRAALDFVLSKAGKRPISYTFYETQQDSVGFQLQVAEAAQLIDTAYLHAFRAADAIDDFARRGDYPGFLERARTRADVGHIADSITRAIDILVSAHGAGAFAEVNPLQRIWRDSATAARHAIVSPRVSQEIYGKALLGVPEPVSPLV
ncbi:acyl-CoA dehydrogenase family protein [Amycolatopsis jejuensis]|uniref:acyl-CoA dehydrogenase family protein n=1 Tax=Amycolatopsis jejuensis TaxID=330084 RepID=UPI00068D2BA6|nr:acyl-CoA dehydrogenase family protein [Amycolatopsis jejuensis]